MFFYPVTSSGSYAQTCPEMYVEGCLLLLGRTTKEGRPWWPRGWESVLPTQGAWV